MKIIPTQKAEAILLHFQYNFNSLKPIFPFESFFILSAQKSLNSGVNLSHLLTVSFTLLFNSRN